MPDIHIDTAHITITGPSAEEIRTIVADELAAALTPLEESMATEAELLNALSAKVDDLVADVRAALAILADARDVLGPDGQAALDALTAKVDAFDTEVGDADGSDTPPV